MNHDNLISLSVWKSNGSLEDFLKELSYSKNQQKKYLPKKYLTRKIKDKEELLLPIDLINHLKINPQYIGQKIKILYEDNKFLVLNKPSKLHCHPLNYSETNNCLSFLASQNIKLENKDFYDRTLLYRLDFETSGVLVLTKKQSDYEYIREHFHTMMKDKIYLAIIEGKDVPLGVLQDHLLPFGSKSHKMKVARGGKLATCEILEAFPHQNQNLTLVKIKLESGLRHQLRVQLSHLGFPILGDTLYGGTQAQRLFLHAYCYRFSYESKEYEFISYEAELFDNFFDLNRVF